MASLRASDAPSAMAVDGERGGWRDTSNSCLLDVAGTHVRYQLRARGLGYPRVDTLPAAPAGCGPLGRVILRDLDLPNPYLFQLH